MVKCVCIRRCVIIFEWHKTSGGLATVSLITEKAQWAVFEQKFSDCATCYGEEIALAGSGVRVCTHLHILNVKNIKPRCLTMTAS
jgi:hypothetical protein